MFDQSAFREIYLVFQDDVSYFMSERFKKGFRHVFALERQALGWTCIDFSRSDLYVTVLPASYDVNIIPEYLRRNPKTTILQLFIKSTNKSIYPRPSMMSCVGGIQYLLGVYWPFVFTPYQLYNKLIKNNSIHIKRGALWQGAEMQGDRPENQQCLLNSR